MNESTDRIASSCTIIVLANIRSSKVYHEGIFCKGSEAPFDHLLSRYSSLCSGNVLRIDGTRTFGSVTQRCLDSSVPYDRLCFHLS